ncbi:hypothetical protein GW17_00045902 [Ensete ventricosum]|nr:hypothetical protein GW17_00045902 [Ensete ventricosum]
MFTLQFNYSSGQPAPESITDKIYGNTLSVCLLILSGPFHLCSSGIEDVVILSLLNFIHIYPISEIKIADIPDVDLSSLGVISYGNFSVEVIDPVSDYLELMEVQDKPEVNYGCCCLFHLLKPGNSNSYFCRMCSILSLSRVLFPGLISGKLSICGEESFGTGSDHIREKDGI